MSSDNSWELKMYPFDLSTCCELCVCVCVGGGILRLKLYYGLSRKGNKCSYLASWPLLHVDSFLSIVLSPCYIFHKVRREYKETDMYIRTFFLFLTDLFSIWSHCIDFRAGILGSYLGTNNT